MSQAFKLLVGNNTHVLETFEEQTNKDEPKKLYLEGVFGEAGRKNKNGRVYDPEEMIEDIKRYNEEFVASGRAYNELNHPSTPDVDLERACDRTVSLRMESDGTVYGKAVIMDTPMGRVQRAMIESGGLIGKSSRAMGQVMESSAKDGSHCDYIKSLRIVCFDSVHDPSVGKAIVDPLLEQREWLIGDDGGFLAKPLDSLEESLVTIPKSNREQYILEAYLKCINSLGK